MMIPGISSDMNQTLTYIIIAYHPHMPVLRALLRTLSGRQVVVVDNGATLKDKDVSGATLLPQSENLGYAAAANIGLKHAHVIGSDWFVVCNQDLVMTKKGLTAFESRIANVPAGIAGPFAGSFDSVHYTTVFPSTKTQYISGSCMAIHTDVVGKIGFLYEPYFMYYEDADYSLRAKAAGFALSRVTAPGISHKESLSLGKGSTLHEYYLARNHMLFVRRCAPSLVRIRETLYMAYAYVRANTSRNTGACEGIRDFFSGRFGRKESV